MKKWYWIIGFVLLTGCTTVKNNESASLNKTKHQKENTSKNALSWPGIYEGILPCADCEGIKTTLTLNKKGTFKLVSHYLNGKSGTSNKVQKGKFAWDSTKPIITLSTKEVFFVGEGYLTKYDEKGKPIKSRLNNTLKQIKIFE